MAVVDSRYFDAVLRCAQRKGFDRNEILANLALSVAPDATKVDRYTLSCVVQHVWSILEDEFLGCTKNPCKVGVFPFMARHVLHYHSLEKMLEQGISFYNLMTDDLRMSLVKRGDVADIEFEFADPQYDPDFFFREFWLVIWHRFSSWLIDTKIVLTQVCFNYPKPEHHQKIKLLFPCRHSFNRPVIKLCFSAKYLALPCARTQRDLTQFLRHSPADLISIPGSEDSFQAKVRSVLLHQTSDILHCPSIEQLADNFNISAQTLRRRLKVESTSYPAIKDEIRRDLAIDYLRNSKLSIGEIANSLGFSEPRSFTRAFKHWTGISPSRFSQR